ncbi:MAG: DUF2061 domain-containing protein [Candidatus Levybacteria bacterium]|nr:DUF2061 domain-containing protein [Candidatus Levybacteria bacterium]
MKHFEHAKRSLVKTITYRILIVIATFIVVYMMTGDIEATGNITLITSIVNTVLYFFHERAWNKIHWGKHK